MKKVILSLMIMIGLFTITGCGNDENIRNDVVDDQIQTDDNNTTNEETNNDKTFKDYDYIIYCDIDKEAGRMAIIGTGSYVEYYVSEEKITGLKQVIVPPTSVSEEQIDEVEKTLKEESPYVEIKRDGRKIIGIADGTDIEETFGVNSSISEKKYCHIK